MVSSNSVISHWPISSNTQCFVAYFSFSFRVLDLKIKAPHRVWTHNLEPSDISTGIYHTELFAKFEIMWFDVVSIVPHHWGQKMKISVDRAGF